MTDEQPLNRQRIRQLYSEACHGAGAEPRRKARIVIEEQAAAAGLFLATFLEAHNLNVAAYFASRPID